MLSCPVCLELFTPPVLVLVCAHNFCKQCLEKILTIQNCTHVNGHFCCPICRKVSRDIHFVIFVVKGSLSFEMSGIDRHFLTLKDYSVKLQGVGSLSQVGDSSAKCHYLTSSSERANIGLCQALYSPRGKWQPSCHNVCLL